MLSPRTLIIVMVGCVAGIGAYLATAGPSASSGSAPTDAVGKWLELTDQQKQAITAADPNFDAESAALNVKLADERQALAQLLEDTAASKQTIMQQVEKVIASHGNLERRVAEHVLAIRSHVTPEQQQRLMGLCAEGVREAAGKQWRHGRNADGTRGRGGAGGGGNGGGGRWRGGRGDGDN